MSSNVFVRSQFLLSFQHRFLVLVFVLRIFTPIKVTDLLIENNLSLLIVTQYLTININTKYFSLLFYCKIPHSINILEALLIQKDNGRDVLLNLAHFCDIQNFSTRKHPVLLYTKVSTAGTRLVL
jgi:hypothetical protein